MSLPTPINWLHLGAGPTTSFYAVGAGIVGGVNPEPYEFETGPDLSKGAKITQFRWWRFFADEYSANEYAKSVVWGRNNDWNKVTTTPTIEADVKSLKIKNTGPLMYKKDGRSKPKPLFGPMTKAYYVKKWGIKPEGVSRYINQVVVVKIELNSKTWSEKEFGQYY